jgi:hypothetical protein
MYAIGVKSQISRVSIRIMQQLTPHGLLPDPRISICPPPFYSALIPPCTAGVPSPNSQWISCKSPSPSAAHYILSKTFGFLFWCRREMEYDDDVALAPPPCVASRVSYMNHLHVGIGKMDKDQKIFQLFSIEKMSDRLIRACASWQ